jgi:hypothetical protein
LIGTGIIVRGSIGVSRVVLIRYLMFPGATDA